MPIEITTSTPEIRPGLTALTPKLEMLEAQLRLTTTQETTLVVDAWQTPQKQWRLAVNLMRSEGLVANPLSLLSTDLWVIGQPHHTQELIARIESVLTSWTDRLQEMAIWKQLFEWLATQQPQLGRSLSDCTTARWRVVTDIRHNELTVWLLICGKKEGSHSILTEIPPMTTTRSPWRYSVSAPARPLFPDPIPQSTPSLGVEKISLQLLTQYQEELSTHLQC